MVGCAEILLGNLELHHHLRLLQGGKQRAVWFAGLEIDGAVLDLDDDIVGKLAVEGHELLVSLVGAIGALGRIDEGAPHHDALVGFQHTGEHIGTVGMGAPEVLRPWLTLGVGLHQKAAEVGDQTVDLLHLLLPPADDLGIERVGSLEAAHLDGRGEVDGEVDTDAVGAQLVGDGLRLLQTLCRECLRLGIHIVEHGAVDADRGIGAGVHPDAFRIGIEEDALSGKAAFHGAVGVIPVVEDAEFVERGGIALFAPEQGIGSVEQTLCVLGGDGGAADAVGIVGHFGVERERGLLALIIGSQLCGSEALGARDLRFVDGLVSQPQLMAVFGLCQRDNGQEGNE